jgi:hypothetical protein
MTQHTLKLGWKLQELRDAQTDTLVATVHYGSDHPATAQAANEWRDRIITAVNSHDTLVEALRALMDRLDDHFGGPLHSVDWKEQEEARAALAPAKPKD